MGQVLPVDWPLGSQLATGRQPQTNPEDDKHSELARSPAHHEDEPVWCMHGEAPHMHMLVTCDCIPDRPLEGVVQMGWGALLSTLTPHAGTGRSSSWLKQRLCRVHIWSAQPARWAPSRGGPLQRLAGQGEEPAFARQLGVSTSQS